MQLMLKAPMPPVNCVGLRTEASRSHPFQRGPAEGRGAQRPHPPKDRGCKKSPYSTHAPIASLKI